MKKYFVFQFFFNRLEGEIIKKNKQIHDEPQHLTQE